MIINNMDIDRDAKKLIGERVLDIKSGRAKNILRTNMLFPFRENEKNKILIKNEIQQYERVLVSIEGLVKNLKRSINHITDRTPLCACYLILGKLINTYKAIFSLAISGYNQEVMELTRSASENNDLIILFSFDKKNEHLNKWLDGEIIKNVKCRELMSELFGESNIESSIKEKIDHKKMTTDVYKAMSKYTHCSYVALLDSVDIFKEDFSFERRAGFHYTYRNSHMLKSALGNTIVALKAVYLGIGDDDSYAKADQLHKEFSGEHSLEDAKNLLDKIS